MYNLTVIVPIYNVEKYLEKCVLSLISQTYSQMCIILVNDGSTDNSGKIADKFAENYDNITVIHKTNGGLSDARNVGIESTNTEYIAFVDSDDYVESNMYEVLLSKFSDEQIDISIGTVLYENEQGEGYCPYKTGISAIWNNEEAMKYLLCYSKFNMSFCDKVFKTKLFRTPAYGEDKLLFPYGKKCEDQFLMCRVLARASRVAYNSIPLYHYVQRFGSISRNTNINLAPLEAVESQLEFYKKWFPSISYTAETAYLYTYMSICSAYYKHSLDCPKEISNKAKSAASVYLKSVFQFKELPLKKKFQAIVFRYFNRLYYVLIK